MAPSFRGRRRKTSTYCKPNCHGILLKKKPNVASDGCCSSKPSSSDHLMEEEEKKKNYNASTLLDKASTDHSGFSTPKAKRSRIPDALSCPPAPKKRRLAVPQRSENSPPLVSFFTSPDLDLFFLYALHEISL